MTDRRTDVTRIIADAIGRNYRPSRDWPLGRTTRMAEAIIIALHEAGYVIAKIPETTDSTTGGLS